MKRYTCTMLASMMILISGSALAQQAPEAQFGFKGWPYRQENPACDPQPEKTALPEAPAQTPRPLSTPAPTGKPTPAPLPTNAVPEKPSFTPPASTGDYTTLSVAAQEQKLLNLLNQDRVAHGLSPLIHDSALSAIARAKSNDMNSNNYFSHTSPTYGNAASMLQHFGYSFNGVGENIAHHATVEKSQAAFMSSEGHRRNILGSQWTKVGIGISIDKNGFIYATQLFVR